MSSLNFPRKWCERSEMVGSWLNHFHSTCWRFV
jgi:hypothetical protein